MSHYRINARVFANTPTVNPGMVSEHVWNSVYDLPLFELDGDLLGITSEFHAENIALGTILRPYVDAVRIASCVAVRVD